MSYQQEKTLLINQSKVSCGKFTAACRTRYRSFIPENSHHSWGAIIADKKLKGSLLRIRIKEDKMFLIPGTPYFNSGDTLLNYY